MSERFYVNLPLTTGPFTLDGPEAHHLATVCRLRPGDAICLFNGDGHEYPARIIKAGRREIALEITGVEEPERELAFGLEVASPLPKGDRCQFLLEKLTELGVTTFVPLLCARSNTHPREAKRDKLERYIIEACKQCGRNTLMKLEELSTWETYVNREGFDELRILAHPGESGILVDLAKSHPQTRIAVGPEGGFTDEEIAVARQHRWQAISLGSRILRIETAAIALVAKIVI